MVDLLSLEKRIEPRGLLVRICVMVRAGVPMGRHRMWLASGVMVKSGDWVSQFITSDEARRREARGMASWCSSKRPWGFSEGGRAGGWLGLVKRISIV